MEASLKKALTDANAGARASGKKAFLAYKSLWSDRADKFSFSFLSFYILCRFAETLDPSVSKLVHFLHLFFFLIKARGTEETSGKSHRFKISDAKK